MAPLSGKVRPPQLAASAKVQAKSEMLICFAAALNQPIDAVANCKNRKASASNGPRGSLNMAGRAIAIPSIVAGLCRRRSEGQSKG